jgi:hypothetical protein
MYKNEVSPDLYAMLRQEITVQQNFRFNSSLSYSKRIFRLILFLISLGL